MAYVPGFKNDIFISYALIDDATFRRDELGWVRQFHQQLEVRLSRLFGRVGAVSIWRDVRSIAGSAFFDEQIRAAIEGSAVFIALTSRGYLAEGSYSRKELAAFHRSAKSGPYGLTVNAQSRVFNVRLQDIPAREWPPELAGAPGFPFYDAQGYGSGFPLKPGSEQFEEQTNSLAHELERMLREFESFVETHTLPSTPPRAEAPEAVAPPKAVGATTRIFICYRRVPGVSHAAGRLYDRLAEQFGDERVFMDVSAIEIGDDFVSVITRELSSCALMFVLINKGWADAGDEVGRRLHEEGDFVRMEISTALKRDIRVVPVLLDGAPMPRAEELPEDLRALARRNAFKVSGESWRRDVGELLARMERHMRE